MKEYINKSNFPYTLITLIVFLFLFKTVFFVGTFGALEHDSGWNLGLAKNLATKGIYASYTNTIIEEKAGPYPNIHNRFSLQDQNGFVYFPAAAAIGPGYIVPQALVIKIFGSGFWQDKAWPLLGFTLLLYIVLFIAHKYGGSFSLVLFSLWLWLVPQFTIQLAYEALSEHIALLFLLLGFILINRSYFLAGIFIAFSYLTKSLFLLPALATLVFTQCDYFIYEHHKKEFIKKWLLICLGIIIPVVVFNTYRHQIIFSNFGKLGLRAFQVESQMVFAQSGSGTDPIKVLSQTGDFLTKKLNVWIDVGIRFPVVLWILYLSSPIIILKYLPVKGKIFLSALFAASFISFIWFIFFSTDGWGRHIWQGLILGMLLISISLGLIYQRIQISNRPLFFAFFIPVSLLLINYSVINASFIFNQNIFTDWATIRKIRGLDGFPSNPILSLPEQTQVVNYIKNNIKSEDRIYYLLGYLNAEISPLVDKVFYSIQRYAKYGQTNPDGGNSYLIVGPYQQGIWSDTQKNYISEVQEKICGKIVFQNASYMLCTITPNLIP